MKIASDQVAHKSDFGGVRLEVEPAQAATAFNELAAALAEHRPGSLLAGVLVGPMRREGTELLVGVVTDPDWGKVLSVGLGGLWVEVLDDVSLRLLPVDEVDVAEMLAELRSAALLKGARRSTPADIDRLCQVIARIAGLAQGLGTALDTLEVNPLRVEGADVEVLDALVVWKGGQL
jgi:succinyl-CoA synthetase beta subunit